MCFYLSEDENGNGNLLLNATLVNVCPRLPLHQSQVSLKNKPTFSTMKKPPHIKYMTASFNFYIRKKTNDIALLWTSVHLLRPRSKYRKKHLPPPSQRSLTFNQGFFSHGYLSDFSYFLLTKKIVRKLQYIIKKSIIWKGCIDGFSYFSLIFSYFIF